MQSVESSYPSSPNVNGNTLNKRRKAVDSPEQLRPAISSFSPGSFSIYVLALSLSNYFTMKCNVTYLYLSHADQKARIIQEERDLS